MKPCIHIVFTLLLGVTCNVAFAAKNDDLWEMTIGIVTGGQSIPQQTEKYCFPKGQNHPAPPDKSCKVTTQGGAVGKGSSVMECEGPMTIKTEGSRTATTMKGTMSMNAQGMTMFQYYDGKIIGTCDVATFMSNP